MKTIRTVAQVIFLLFFYTPIALLIATGLSYATGISPLVILVLMLASGGLTVLVYYQSRRRHACQARIKREFEARLESATRRLRDLPIAVNSGRLRPPETFLNQAKEALAVAEDSTRAIEERIQILESFVLAHRTMLDEVATVVAALSAETELERQKVLEVEDAKQLWDYYHKEMSIREADISKMSGAEFEKYLYKVFIKLGYSCKLTRSTGDQGADLIVEIDGRRIAVQAKRSSSSVGNRAVQEAIAATRFYNCSHAMVVTNNLFTAAACQLARKAQNVTLVDRYALSELITRASESKLPDFSWEEYMKCKGKMLDELRRIDGARYILDYLSQQHRIRDDLGRDLGGWCGTTMR